MPRRYTKTTTRRTRPFVPQTVEEGVYFQRNGIIIDASVCKAFQNWSAAECPTEDQPKEIDQHAPHAVGGQEGDSEPMRE